MPGPMSHGGHSAIAYTILAREHATHTALSVFQGGMPPTHSWAVPPASAQATKTVANSGMGRQDQGPFRVSRD